MRSEFWPAILAPHSKSGIAVKSVQRHGRIALIAASGFLSAWGAMHWLLASVTFGITAAEMRTGSPYRTHLRGAADWAIAGAAVIEAMTAAVQAYCMAPDAKPRRFLARFALWFIVGICIAALLALIACSTSGALVSPMLESVVKRIVAR